MKKLTATITAILALSIGALGIQAQRSNPKPAKTNVAKNKPVRNIGGNGYHRRVHQYTTVKIVRKRHGKFKNTYLNTVYPNGRTKVKLIKSERIGRNIFYGPQTYFRTQTVYQGRKAFRVTYKIIKFPNGHVTRKVVRKVRIH